MKYNEHILTYKAHRDNNYLNDLLSKIDQCEEDYDEDECEFTPRQNYFVELHYAKRRDTYPNKDCDVCEVEEHFEYICIKCEVTQSGAEWNND